jgi:protein-disulfide isomerase
VTDPDTPTTEAPAPAPASLFDRLLTQANLTTALAVVAVVLAGASYVVPQVQAWQVKRGLMNNPAMLVDASKALQRKQMAEAAEAASLAIKAHHDSIFNDKNDPVIGKGPIKVVEFLDYQCAYCRAATPAIRDFLNENPDVQLVIKEYPVVHPPVSAALAQVGMAAFRGGHYEPIHYDLLDATPKSDAEMDAILTKAGLDPKTVRDAAISEDVKSHIDRTVTLGSDLGINGTPTFIVGDQMINGADINLLQKAVQAQRSAKKPG